MHRCTRVCQNIGAPANHPTQAKQYFDCTYAISKPREQSMHAEGLQNRRMPHIIPPQHTEKIYWHMAGDIKCSHKTVYMPIVYGAKVEPTHLHCLAPIYFHTVSQRECNYALAPQTQMAKEWLFANCWFPKTEHEAMAMKAAHKSAVQGRPCR